MVELGLSLNEFPLHTLPAAAIKDKKMMLQPSNFLFIFFYFLC
jgi:hypothetical protein